MGKWKIKPEDDLKIKELYLKGVSCLGICKEYKVSHYTILRSLERSGVKRRSISKANTKFTCDSTYFKDINTESKAYWLGFISGDGYLNLNQLSFVLTLAIKDINHLEEFRRAINATHTVKTYNYSYPFCRMYIRDNIFCKVLHNYFDNTKSSTLRMPNIPNQYVKDYIRGYFDANGSISGANNPRFEISSNKYFLEDIREYLVRDLGISITKNSIRHKDKPIFQTLRYGGKYNLQKIYRFLYDGCNIYLPRKKFKFEELLKI
jgi:hypothetical protein